MHYSGKRINLIEVLFYIGFMMNFYVVFMQITMQDIPYSFIAIIISIFCFGFVSFKTKYQKKELVIWIIVVALAFIYLLEREDTNPIRIVLMLMSSKNINKDIFLQNIKRIWILAIVIALILAMFNLTNFYTEGYWGVKRGLERRYCFGFDGPNRISVVGVNIIAVNLIKKNKLTFQWTIVLLMLGGVLFLFTKSRTGIISIFVLVFYPYFEHFMRRYILQSSFFRKIIPYAILFMILVATYIVSHSENIIFMNHWNEVFNNRFVHLYEARSLMNISPFGVDVIETVGGLDNSYFLSFFSWGYCLYACYLCLVVKLIAYIWKNKGVYNMAVMVTFLIMPFVIELIHYSTLNGIFILSIFYYDELFVAGVKREYEKSLENNKKICSIK